MQPSKQSSSADQNQPIPFDVGRQIEAAFTHVSPQDLHGPPAGKRARGRPRKSAQAEGTSGTANVSAVKREDETDFDAENQLQYTGIFFILQK